MDKLHKVALYVPPIDKNFDPNEPPQSGEQYLQQMMYERNNCPDIMVAKTKCVTRKPIQWKEQNRAENPKIKDFLHPTPEWEKLQMLKFKNIQNQVIKVREEQDLMEVKTPRFPNENTKEKWFQFCKIHQPVLKTVLQIDQRTLEELIDIETEWLNNEYWSELFQKDIIDLSTTEKWISEWIYASLACIKLPVEPDLHSMLRALAKCCINMRKLYSPFDEPKLAPLNVFICIIANNFNQLDLSDNFNL